MTQPVRTSLPTRHAYMRMTALVLLVAVGVALLLPHPGYTDAFYYFNIGQRLAQGKGFTDVSIFTYLGLPTQGALPMPSHLYWMPLPSIVTALGLKLTSTFHVAQVGFIACYVGLVLTTFWLGARLGGTRRAAWLSGLLMLFSGYFVPFWTTTSTFALFGLTGAWALISMGLARSSGRWWLYGLSGALIGLAHLTRADGVLLLAVLVIVAVWPSLYWKQGWIGVITGVLAYGLVMLPWFLRNQQVVGSILPVGGFQTAWARSYDEIVNYPAGIQLSDFVAWGPLNILYSRAQAFMTNLGTLIAVEGMFVLVPLAFLYGWLKRREPLLSGFWLYALGLHATMTLIFAFSGARGGLFHSSAALMPFWIVCGVLGLQEAITWAAKWRRWRVNQAQTVFSSALLLLALALSVASLASKLNNWQGLGEFYRTLGVERDAPVIINDPAAYVYFTNGQALVLPNSPPEVVVDLALRFKAAYIVLDENYTKPLESLWLRQNVPQVLRQHRYGNGVRIYKVTLD